MWRVLEIWRLGRQDILAKPIASFVCEVSRGAGCADPGDKLFTLLALANWQSRAPLEANYTKTTLTLAHEVITVDNLLPDDSAQTVQKVRARDCDEPARILSVLGLSKYDNGIAKSLCSRRLDESRILPDEGDSETQCVLGSHVLVETESNFGANEPYCEPFSNERNPAA